MTWTVQVGRWERALRRIMGTKGGSGGLVLEDAVLPVAQLYELTEEQYLYRGEFLSLVRFAQPAPGVGLFTQAWIRPSSGMLFIVRQILLRSSLQVSADLILSIAAPPAQTTLATALDTRLGVTNLSTIGAATSAAAAPAGRNLGTFSTQGVATLAITGLPIILFGAVNLVVVNDVVNQDLGTTVVGYERPFDAEEQV